MSCYQQCTSKQCLREELVIEQPAPRGRKPRKGRLRGVIVRKRRQKKRDQSMGCHRQDRRRTCERCAVRAGRKARRRINTMSVEIRTSHCLPRVHPARKLWAWVITLAFETLRQFYTHPHSNMPRCVRDRGETNTTRQHAPDARTGHTRSARRVRARIDGHACPTSRHGCVAGPRRHRPCSNASQTPHT